MPETLADLLRSVGVSPSAREQFVESTRRPGYVVPRPRPRTMRSSEDRAHDPNAGVSAQARRQQQAAYNAAQQGGALRGRLSRAEAYDPGIDPNTGLTQGQEAILGAAEFTGAPSLLRSYDAFEQGRPWEGAGHAGLGALAVFGNVGVGAAPRLRSQLPRGAAFDAPTRLPVNPPREIAANGLPIRPSEPFRNSLRGGGDDLAEAAALRPRGLDAGVTGAGQTPSRYEVEPLGANEYDAYHGTAATFEAYDRARRGALHPEYDAQNSFMLTSNPRLASDYAYEAAEEAAQKKRLVARGDPEMQALEGERSRAFQAMERAVFPWTRSARAQRYDALVDAHHNRLRERAPSEGANVRRERVTLRNPLVSYEDWEGGNWNEVIRRAREEGRDGVIFRNVRDTSDYAGKSRRGDVYAVFNENNIQSYWQNVRRTPFSGAEQTPRAAAAMAPDGGARGGGQFDTSRVVYRGLGRQYDPANGGYYQSFTSSLDDAREYGSNVVAAHIRPGRNLAVDGGGRNFNVLGIEQLPADVRARLHPSVGETATTDQIAHAAREAGYDSVTIRNVHDNRWGERPIAGAEPRTIDFVFNTENIRPLDSVPPQAAGAAPAIGEKVRLSAADRALLDDLLGPEAPPDGGARGGGNAYREQLRAEGFDVEAPLYHGTTREFSDFDLNAPQSDGVDLYGRGIYLTGDSDFAARSFASEFSGGQPNIRPVYARLSNPLVITPRSAREARTQIAPEAAAQIVRDAGGSETVAQAIAASGRPIDAYTFWHFSLQDTPTRARSAALQRAGFDGIIADPNAEMGATGSRPHVVVFDPANVRSRLGPARTAPTASNGPPKPQQTKRNRPRPKAPGFFFDGTA